MATTQCFLLLAVLGAAMATMKTSTGEYDIRVYAQNTSCTEVPAATVKFLASCATVDVKDAACWAPKPPTVSDVVEFPAGTNAKVAFSNAYYPVRAKSVVLAKGATVDMEGGAFEVTECFFVQGNLLMKPQVVDMGSAPQDGPFLADKSMPFYQDCKEIGQGFTPRICGPGQMVIQHTVNMQGLYASLFLHTFVARGGVLSVNKGAFLWGNTTNHGVITSDSVLYIHGHLFNYHNANFQSVRFDKWLKVSLQGVYGAMLLHNEGTMSFVVTEWSNWGFSDIVNVDGRNYSIYENPMNYTLKLTNKGSILYSALNKHYYNPFTMFSKIKIDTFNFGSITWNCTGGTFYSSGTTVNFGHMTAATPPGYGGGFVVQLSDYMSDGGRMVQDGGIFSFGNGAGVDEKTTTVCKKRKEKGPAANVRKLSVHSADVVQTNQTCNPKQWDSCPLPLCCGASGKCETARCQNAEGYGGGPMCCLMNTFCGGSSHGAYCGNGAFLWQIDTDCVEELQYVDRFEFDAMKAAFHTVKLPTFGRSRYTFRGNSVISGTGSGAVRFTEPIEVIGTLRILDGGVLRSVVEGSEPFRGSEANVVVAKGGKFVSGVKAHYNGPHRVHVQAGGEFSVPRHTSIYVKSSAPLTFDHGAVVRVDGQVVIMSDDTPETHGKLFCDVTGAGTVVSDEHKRC